jgi:hypothetical protein
VPLIDVDRLCRAIFARFEIKSPDVCEAKTMYEAIDKEPRVFLQGLFHDPDGRVVSLCLTMFDAILVRAISLLVVDHGKCAISLEDFKTMLLARSVKIGGDDFLAWCTPNGNYLHCIPSATSYIGLQHNDNTAQPAGAEDCNSIKAAINRGTPNAEGYKLIRMPNAFRNLDTEDINPDYEYDDNDQNKLATNCGLFWVVFLEQYRPQPVHSGSWLTIGGALSDDVLDYFGSLSRDVAAGSRRYADMCDYLADLIGSLFHVCSPAEQPLLSHNAVEEAINKAANELMGTLIYVRICQFEVIKYGSNLEVDGAANWRDMNIKVRSETRLETASAELVNAAVGLRKL